MRTSARAVARVRENISRVDALGRRYLSLEQKQQIVAEALAANASVAEVARRHDLNANLVFNWIRQARAGWPDRRRVKDKRDVQGRDEPMSFIPVTLIDGSAKAHGPSPQGALTIDRAVVAAQSPKEAEGKHAKRRGIIEIIFPDGAQIRVDAEVNEAALRLVLKAMKGL
jgi:transposase